MPLHIVHGAVVTRRQPSEQTGLGMRQFHRRHANLGESQLTAPKLQLRWQPLLLNGHIIPLNQTPIVKTLNWPDERSCQAFAQQLSTQPELSNAVLCLRGDLGCGKTTLTRYLLQALGFQGRVKSPTYAVVEGYELMHQGQPLQVWHFDFYRFKDPQEWEDAGFRDMFAEPGLKVCEWPEKASGFLPTADLDLQWHVNIDDSREVTVSANTAIGGKLVP
jgi:tRNA threonylcarbamoyladenosine biosynthesis protein TsaE